MELDYSGYRGVATNILLRTVTYCASFSPFHHCTIFYSRIKIPALQLIYHLKIPAQFKRICLNLSETDNEIIACGAILTIYVGRPTHSDGIPPYFAYSAIAWKIFLY